MLLWVLNRGCLPDVRGGHCVVLKDNNALGTQMQLGVWSKGGNSLESGRGKMFERWLKLGVLHPVSQYSYIRANILKKIK